MNKEEMARILRNEVGELELCIQKAQARCDRLKRFVLDLEEEVNPSQPEQKTILDGKFCEVIDKVFGEKPKRRAPKK